MADITLADCNGQIWVMGGEEHLDGLLLNQLPPHLTVEIVPCEPGAALYALWDRHSPGSSDSGAMPWALNPALTRRLLGRLGLSSGLLRFTPWSAMLDEPARQEIADAAAWLACHADGRLLLRQFAVAPAVPGLAELQTLRGQLVAAALAEAGVAAERIATESAAAAKPADGERLQIVMERVTV